MVCGGETRAQVSYKTLCLLVTLYIPILKYDHMVRVVTERIRFRVQVAESYIPLQGSSGCFSVKVQGAQDLGVKLLLLDQKAPCELVWASSKDALWLVPSRAGPGMFN